MAVAGVTGMGVIGTEVGPPDGRNLAGIAGTNQSSMVGNLARPSTCDLFDYECSSPASKESSSPPGLQASQSKPDKQATNAVKAEVGVPLSDDLDAGSSSKCCSEPTMPSTCAFLGACQA